MPRRMVTMKPPGSRPGITSLAKAPTINPKRIHPSMLSSVCSYVFCSSILRQNEDREKERASKMTSRVGRQGRTILTVIDGLPKKGRKVLSEGIVNLMDHNVT